MRSALVISTLVLTALLGCGMVPVSPQPGQVPESKAEPTTTQSAVVQSLQRQVRERDRRIAELTFQLEALKTIDRETEPRRLPSLHGTPDR